MSHGIQEKEEDRREEEGSLEEEVFEEGVHRVSQGWPQQAHLPGMSVFIGNVKGPNHNSPDDVASVWCSLGYVELTISGDKNDPDYSAWTVRRSLDPIAARNLAALLVRASEEADRMAARAAFKARTDDGERE